MFSDLGLVRLVWLFLLDVRVGVMVFWLTECWWVLELYGINSVGHEYCILLCMFVVMVYFVCSCWLLVCGLMLGFVGLLGLAFAVCLVVANVVLSKSRVLCGFALFCDFCCFVVYELRVRSGYVILRLVVAYWLDVGLRRGLRVCAAWFGYLLCWLLCGFSCDGCLVVYLVGGA